MWVDRGVFGYDRNPPSRRGQSEEKNRQGRLVLMWYVDYAVAANEKNIILEVVVGMLIKGRVLVKRNYVGMAPNPEGVAMQVCLLPAKLESSTDGTVASIMDWNALPLSSSNKVRIEA